MLSRRSVPSGALCAALALLALPTRADAVYAIGAPGNCTVYANLAAAVSAACLAGGDRIWVSNTNVELASTQIGCDIDLASAQNLCNAGGAGRVELDPAVLDRLIEVMPGPSVADRNELTLTGVTLSGGDRVGDGGTIYLHPDTALFVNDGPGAAGPSRIELGHATGRGGCIYAEDSWVVMQSGTSVAQCLADTDGGGVALVGVQTPGLYHHLYGVDENEAVAGSGGGAYVDSAPVCMYDATDNTAALDGGAAYVTSGEGAAWLGAFDLQDLNDAGRDGGALFVTGASATIDVAGTLQANVAARDGGGVRATTSAAVFLDPGSRVTENRAQGDGGGLHADALATVYVSDLYDAVAIGAGEGFPPGTCGDAVGAVSVDANVAGFDAGGLAVATVEHGGGFFLSGATLDGTATDEDAPLLVSGNVARDDGGGIGATASTVTLLRTTLDLNVATYGDGGGLLATGGTSATLDTVRVLTNTAAGGGGGLAFEGGSANLDRLEVEANAAPFGGGIAARSAATLDLDESEVTGNTAFGGGGLYLGSGSTLTFREGTVHANTATTGGGLAAVSSLALLGSNGGQCTLGSPCVELTDNVATGGVARGGAIVLGGANARVEARRTRMVGNLADQGAATWMDRADQTLYLHDAAVLDNHGNNGLVSAVAVAAGDLSVVHATIAHNDTGIALAPVVAATLDNSLVVQNLIDIGGLALGATVTGDCNGVQYAATQAAIVGVDNEDTAPANASVDPVTGAPINTADIVDECVTGLLPRDLEGTLRPQGVRHDRGAFEQ